MNTAPRHPGSIKRWWLRCKARFRNRPLVQWDLSCDDRRVYADWFRVDYLDQGQIVALWAEITEVAAFQRDCYAVDLMCVQFNSTDGSTLEVNEDMPGFKDLVCALPQHLPGCLPFDAWWHTVAVPAFKTNLTVIWKRD